MYPIIEIFHSAVKLLLRAAEEKLEDPEVMRLNHPRLSKCDSFTELRTFSYFILKCRQLCYVTPGQVHSSHLLPYNQLLNEACMCDAYYNFSPVFTSHLSADWKSCES